MDKLRILRILRKKGFKETIEYLDKYPSFESFDYVSRLLDSSKYNSPDYFYFYQGYNTVSNIMTCNPISNLNLLIAHRKSLVDGEYQDAIACLISFIDVILNCRGEEKISELIFSCCGVVIPQPEAKIIFLKYLLPPIQIFHGGCHGCTKQHYKGIGYCNRCQLRGARWELDDKYSNELESVKD